jgi:glycolate oxidase iron-sulfur subunit
MRALDSSHHLPGLQRAESDAQMRKCVRCGFCLSTCPTYELIGNEADSPRGRIALMQTMLATDVAPDREAVGHIDRCLGCLSCKTTCPSGVDYESLLDRAREHIELTYRRPLLDRALRAGLLFTLTHPLVFRLGLAVGRKTRFMQGAFPAPLRRMLELAPRARASRAAPETVSPTATYRGRVILFEGCVQPTLRPEINRATRRLLERNGVEVITIRGEGCCAALPAHLGRSEMAKALARKNIIAWENANVADVDAIIVTASGCVPTIAKYGALLGSEPEWASRAQAMAALATELSVYLHKMGLNVPARDRQLPRVAYQAACSMQHALGIRSEPKALLEAAGFALNPVREEHMCCGSAGIYSILQPDISAQLRDRKTEALIGSGVDVVASGNIGCITQLGSGALPVVHYAELLDWAAGGPCPPELTGSVWA